MRLVRLVTDDDMALDPIELGASLKGRRRNMLRDSESDCLRAFTLLGTGMLHA